MCGETSKLDNWLCDIKVLWRNLYVCNAWKCEKDKDGVLYIIVLNAFLVDSSVNLYIIVSGVSPKHSFVQSVNMYEQCGLSGDTVVQLGMSMYYASSREAHYGVSEIWMCAVRSGNWSQ